MKKLIPVIAILIIGAAVFYFINTSTSIPSSNAARTASTTEEKTSGTTKDQLINDIQKRGPGAVDAAGNPIEFDGPDLDEPEKPATEAYKSADEAIKAIKNGAVDYDDRILEQFTEVGEDCTWCDTVYSQVKDMMLAPETPQDQRSYYAELLAVSGRVSNVGALVDGIKNAPNQETADALSEALELTVGKNDVTQFLGDQLTTANDTLKESLVAAITNQGSRLAADILYKNTVEKGDPDGYYSQGIGLGELVPDESAMPYLQEIVLKRDQYSHLAVKSLLNNGLDGLKLVMSSLSNSPNPDFDQKMLKDAVDHVPYDDETRDYLTKIVETEKDPVVVQFAKDILENSKGTEEIPEEPEEPEAPEVTAPGSR
jgi:hypothetical protein